MEDLDPWMSAQQAETVANRSGIRIARDKELIYVAVVDDNVVGAVWSAWYRDDQSDAMVFNFDVAVDPQYRGQALIGLRLIDSALQEYKYESGTFERSYIRVYVVNPRLVRVLENRYGFETEEQYSHGAAHMVRYA